MSPRAAWRLEQLGFTHVYDYTAGKIDWIAAGWSTEGPGPAQPRVLSAMDPNVPTCHLTEEVGAVRRRLGDGPTFCVVVNERRIVAARLEHLDRIDPQGPRPAGEIMRAGPTTIRPSEDLRAVRQRMSERQVPQLLITTPEGELLGLVRGD
jgi:CBS domain-containing protein